MAFPNSYNSYLQTITGSQVTIPSAVYSWSVLAQSGTTFINNVPVFAGDPIIKGGGYNGFKLNGATTIVVGCTGRALVKWDY